MSRHDVPEIYTRRVLYYATVDGTDLEFEPPAVVVIPPDQRRSWRMCVRDHDKQTNCILQLNDEGDWDFVDERSREYWQRYSVDAQNLLAFVNRHRLPLNRDP